MAISPYNDTKLLLHFDEDPFTDSSLNNYNITNAGGVTRSAVESVFGGYSGYFDGTATGYVTVEDSEDWNVGSEDFTLSFRAFPTTLLQNSDMITRRDSEVVRGFVLDRLLTQWRFYATSNDSTWDICSGLVIGVAVQDAWNHVVVTRQGNNFYTFLNGVPGATTSSALAIADNNVLNIGSAAGAANTRFTGYIDELRIVKGQAIWTSGFTPPTSSYTIGAPSGSYPFTIYSEYIDADLSWFPATVSLSGAAYSDFFINSNDTDKNYYFEDASGNKLYTEVENIDTANQLATFHTAVPTVSAGADTALTFNWDFSGRDFSVRALPSGDYADDFTGANGSSPDTTKWEFVGTTTSIQSNKLNMSLGAGASNADTQAHWIPEDIVGNFDIQVDFDLVTYPATSYWGAQLGVEDIDGEGCSLVRGWYGQHDYRTWENGAAWQGIVVTTDTSGKLRVTRVGTVWTTYTWNGSSWDTNHTWDPGTAGDVDTVYLTLNHGDTNPACETNWDNFQFNHSQYNPDEVNDTFTGTNGDPPDEMKWSGAGGDVTIQGNKIRGASVGGVDQRIRGKPILSGDFDFQIDFDVIAGPATNGWMGGIGIKAPNADQFYIYRGYRDGSHRYTTWETGSPWSAFSNTGDTSGKLRMTRVGSTAYAYYWSGTDWTELRTFAIGTDDLTFHIDTDSFTGNPTVTMDYDNFQINGADSITGWTDDTGNLPAQTVWDSNFKIVTHLAQTPTGAADDILDSTSNEFHGTSYNMGAGNSGDSALGKYLTFDGTEEFIDFGDAFYSDDITMEAVSNVTSFTGGQPRMVVLKRNEIGTATTNSAKTEWATQYIDADTVSIQGWDANTDIVVNCSVNSATDLTGIEIYQAHGCEVAPGGNPTFTQLNDTANDCVRNNDEVIINEDAAWQIGTRSNNNNSRWFLGDIREVRISNISRSEAWRKATYYSLFGTLYDEASQTLTIQDMNIVTSSDDITDIVLNLIIQNLETLTSADLVAFALELDINNLNIGTILNEMNFPSSELSSINTTVDMRKLLRILQSKTPARSITSKTIKRILSQYNG